MGIAELFDEVAPNTSGLSVDQMIREYVRLDKRVKEAAAERSAYHVALLERAAVARNGQNTVHLETADGKQKIKVEFKRKYQSDQMSIECARGLLMSAEEEAQLPAEQEFRDLFKIEYTPKLRNLKTFLNTLTGNERTAVAKEMIKEAVREVEATPYLSVEKS